MDSMQKDSPASKWEGALRIAPLVLNVLSTGELYSAFRWLPYSDGIWKITLIELFFTFASIFGMYLLLLAIHNQSKPMGGFAVHLLVSAIIFIVITGTFMLQPDFAASILDDHPETLTGSITFLGGQLGISASYLRFYSSRRPKV